MAYPPLKVNKCSKNYIHSSNPKWEIDTYSLGKNYFMSKRKISNDWPNCVHQAKCLLRLKPNKIKIKMMDFL